MERVRTQEAVTVINEILMKARRGTTASPQCPKNGNKSAQRSQKQRARQGQAPRPGCQHQSHPLTEHSLGPQAGPRAGHRPHYLRAGTCSESTCLDFPDLSSPLSDLPLLTDSPRHPPTHTLFLLTLPFHFCSKTNNPGQMCQLASGKGSLQHELCGGYTARGGGAGG